MNYKFLTIALAATLSVPGQAHALSCAAGGFDLSSTYNRLADSKEKAMFVVGSFSGGPKRSNPGTFGGKTKTYKMTFTGSAIGKNGLKPFRKNITVKSFCLSAWCGAVPANGSTIIAAVNIEPGGKMLLKSSACSSHQFEASKANIKLVQQCMKSGSCE